MYNFVEIFKLQPRTLCKTKKSYRAWAIPFRRSIRIEKATKQDRGRPPFVLPLRFLYSLGPSSPTASSRSIDPLIHRSVESSNGSAVRAGAAAGRRGPRFPGGGGAQVPAVPPRRRLHGRYPLQGLPGALRPRLPLRPRVRTTSSPATRSELFVLGQPIWSRIMQWGFF